MNTTESITQVLSAMRELSHAGICYYDLRDFFHYDKFGIQLNRGHYCDFCKRVRELPGGRPGCEKSDRSEAVRLATQYREPFFFECHMGMKELIIPLMSGEVLLGILFVGQCRIEEDPREKLIVKNTRRLGGNSEELLNLYQALPQISQQDLINIGTILSQYFHTKIQNNELLAPGSAGNVPAHGLAVSIHHYVMAHYRSNISPGSIAEVFGVNASYASRCFHKQYQITITDHINRVRIQQAKALLATTSVPIGSIAMNVGYLNSNYFSRIFRKLTGQTPLEFRNSTSVSQ